METQVRTPQSVFMLPQRFLVPLFQRPYVWNQENQWEPLWDDVTRGAERLLKSPQAKHPPHFLGAVVLQQTPNVVGQMQTRTIIDGQQRLTTLQLLLDALHAELLAVEATTPAARIQPLVENAVAFCTRPEDRFKVWPTNRDRPAFNAVMGAAPPVDHDATGFKGERMVEAHRFFSEEARAWLEADGSAAVEQRGSALELVARELLQMVVIDLAAEENAQEIFETLNARGAQLTAADLIKNFVFQRLTDSGSDVEKAYEQHWKDFETAFWETEVSVGRIRYARSSLFLNHWLIARTGEEVVAREIFDQFKRYVSEEASGEMPTLIGSIHAASSVYRRLTVGAVPKAGPVDRLELFLYRTGVLESEVVKPLMLCLLDPDSPPVPEDQLLKAIESVESWMVRRMLVRATTKAYNKVIAELIGRLQGSSRSQAGVVVEDFFKGATGESTYWPDDDEVRRELKTLPVYRRLSRGRLRMVLEAIEDNLRGWKDGKPGLGGERVARAQYAIEHIMPRKWQAHWPLGDGTNEADRERQIHTIGNLTLLTKTLNGSVSNGPWLGKREALAEHDVLVLNRELLKHAGSSWTDTAVTSRSEQICEVVIQIWPAPPGHRAVIEGTHKPVRRRKIGLPDLIAAGVLQPPMTLAPRRKVFAGRLATLLLDGQIEVDGKLFSRPSDAATLICGKRTNGWGFFLVDPAKRWSLRDVRKDYVSTLAGEVEDDDGDGNGDGDDDAE